MFGVRKKREIILMECMRGIIIWLHVDGMLMKSSDELSLREGQWVSICSKKWYPRVLMFILEFKVRKF